MAEFDSSQHLKHDSLDKTLLRPRGVALKVVKSRVVYKLKHKVKTFLSTKHLNQVDQVLVANLQWTHTQTQMDTQRFDRFDRRSVVLQNKETSLSLRAFYAAGIHKHGYSVFSFLVSNVAANKQTHKHEQLRQPYATFLPIMT